MTWRRIWKKRLSSRRHVPSADRPLFVTPIIVRYNIFSRLSSVGKTGFALAALLFNSFRFLIFFPCVFFYYTPPFRFRKYMLPIASYYFQF